VSPRRASRSTRDTSDQPAFPLTAPSRRRGSVPEPEEAARIAIARRAKPSPVPDHVRLILTPELRRALAEKLSERATREEQNIEAIVIALIDAAAKRCMPDLR
jgi:hypothetical protein